MFPLPPHEGTLLAPHALPLIWQLFMGMFSTCVALTRRGGQRNAAGSAGRDLPGGNGYTRAAGRQGGAALLIPSIFITALPLRCSHPGTSAITPLLTTSLMPQIVLEEGGGAEPCCAWSMAKKVCNINQQLSGFRRTFLLSMKILAIFKLLVFSIKVLIVNTVREKFRL